LSEVSKFCQDPSFFAAAVAALNNRHIFEPAIWKWSVVHQHGPAVKQLLQASVLAQQLQTQYRVPVGKLLDSVFGSSTPTTRSSNKRGGGGGGSTADQSGVEVVVESEEWGVCDDVLKHLEFWPWVNPYCRPITQSERAAGMCCSGAWLTLLSCTS
jgi:hypothetical protein